MRAPFLRVMTGCAIGLTLVAGACNKEEPPPTPAAVTNPVDPATAGSITGVVKFDGKAPAAQPITMDSDPYCETQPKNSTESVVVGSDCGLQNVFVYVQDGVGDRVLPVPTAPVVLDQNRRSYVPHEPHSHVAQTLDIVSSDNTLHNVHAVPQQNREFNEAHQLAGIKHTHVFSTKEVMIPFKCDVHK